MSRRVADQSAAAHFRAAFEALGYRRTQEYEIFGQGDRWYLFEGSTPAVTHVAYLEYKPALRTYAVAFGVFNAEARARAIAALPSVVPYLHPTFNNGTWPLNGRPCWTLFDAAQMLNWKRMCIPEPLAPEQWPTRLKEIVEELLQPIFWSIDSPFAIQSLLLKKSRKFEWTISYSVLRVAEIVALARIIGCDDVTLEEQLSEHRSETIRDMYSSKNFEEMLNIFLRSI